MREHEPGVGLPPGALLGPEQAVGGLCPVKGPPRLPCCQRTVGRRQQQFGPPGRPAVGLRDVAYCGVRLGQRVTDQAGGQQYIAAVQAEKGRRHIKRPIARGCLIKKGKRSGKVS